MSFSGGLAVTEKKKGIEQRTILNSVSEQDTILKKQITREIERHKERDRRVVHEGLFRVKKKDPLLNRKRLKAV